MKIYYYFNEPVTIISKLPNNCVLISYSDGYEEVVNKQDLVSYNVSNNERRNTRFEKHFGSEQRVNQIRAMPCVICGALPSQNAHVKSRGAGGTYKSIVPLCATHHQEQERIGIHSFEQKYNIDLMSMAHEVSHILDID